MIRLRSERLEIRELPPAAGGKVARFVAENWGFHRQWEPERAPDYFTAAVHRRILRAERISESVVHFWLLRHPGTGTGRRWRRAEIVGSASLSCIVRGAFQSCFLGYKTGEKYTRQGYMTEALRVIVSYAFDELGLHRVEANIIPRNIASLELVRRLGFREEGLSRRYLKIAGTWEDHVHMTVLSDEWDPTLDGHRRSRDTVV